MWFSSRSVELVFPPDIQWLIEKFNNNKTEYIYAPLVSLALKITDTSKIPLLSLTTLSFMALRKPYGI